jgi:hypothetical protein
LCSASDRELFRGVRDGVIGGHLPCSMRCGGLRAQRVELLGGQEAG